MLLTTQIRYFCKRSW